MKKARYIKNEAKMPLFETTRAGWYVSPCCQANVIEQELGIYTCDDCKAVLTARTNKDTRI